MLRIIQSRSVVSAQSYYSKSDYYSEGQELAGRWGGIGAGRLGLSGEIQQHEFELLCHNKHPKTGEKLSPRTDEDRTVGYDFNFHVPKGVSVAYMLGRDERILTAFQQAVRETMEELEVDAKTRVRVGGRDDERVTGNLVWGEFVHMTARPVDGIPDPHLHAHCFVFNQTFDEKEERWKAAQFRDIKRDAPYYQAAFYARFGKSLTELGYPIERRGKQWDLAHVPKSVSKKFSRRTQQVEEHAANKGIETASEKDKLGAKTREAKASELSISELRTIWTERLTTEERESLGGLGQQTGREAAPLLSPAAAMEHAVSHCFERNSVVASRQLLAEALTVGIGSVTPDAAKAAMSGSKVIVRQWKGREMATTAEVLSEERQLLDFARSGRGRAAALNRNWTIKRAKLNVGQRGAVRHVTESRDRVMIINGMAGTGKTTLMEEAVEAIEAGGHQVFTFAPSAEASRNVLRSEGFANATTVAELLCSETIQAKIEGQVLWIDEAGLLGTRQLKEVFDLAERCDARVILSGDWRQHKAVERGAAMRLLEQEGGIRPAVVSAIQRQDGEYRTAVSLLAEGLVEEGFDMLDHMGWIRDVAPNEQAGCVAKEYADTIQSTRKSPLVVSPTHAEGRRITDAIRSELKARGLLSAKEETIHRLISLNLTEAERSDQAAYDVGDIIVFHQNAAGHCKGERIVLNEPPSVELLRHAKRFQAYRVDDLELSVGDRVRFTANGQTKDGKHRLNNGANYEVAGFTRDGDIRLDNGWIVGREHGFLAHGYVVTSHASQGKTYDKVIIAESAESLAAASREQFYVSISRGRHSAVVFTDSKTALRDAVKRSSSSTSATELLSQRPRPQQCEDDARRSIALADRASDKRRQQATRVLEVAHDRG